jgi:hypothetical protein
VEHQDVYTATILEVFLSSAEVLEVDLSRPLTAATRDTLAAMLSGPFGILTAHNPQGRPTDAAENERRGARLDEELHRRQLHFIRVDGRSPDGLHRERGVAVPLPEAEVAELARHFDQEAYYWFDGKDFWLVDTRGAQAPLRLPG